MTRALLLSVLLIGCGDDGPGESQQLGTCATLVTRVAECAADPGFADAYVEALAAIVPELDPAARAALRDGLVQRLGAAAPDPKDFCRAQIADGMWARQGDLSAAITAAKDGSSCAAFAAVLGAAQAAQIDRRV